MSSGALPPVLGLMAARDAALREAAVGCLYWLNREIEVQQQVARASVTPTLLAAMLAPCGAGGRERRAALHVLATLPAQAAGGAAGRGVLKCLAAVVPPPSEEDAFSVAYPSTAFAARSHPYQA